MADNFEAREEDTVEEVLKMGGGVSISARYYVHQKTDVICKIRKSTGATLILRDTDPFETSELVEIARVGGKSVIMEIRSSKNEPYRS